MPVVIRAYLSPTLVLLALDWPEGANREDFLGFAVKRTPGFRNPSTRVQNAFDWLPNRLTFDGPIPADEPDAPSNKAPIQKFIWWDARFGPEPGGTVTYEAFPVCGSPTALNTLDTEKGRTTVTLPPHVVDGIGTWFNRAVLSSQAFSRKVAALGVPKGQKIPDDKLLALRQWLGNGMETVVPNFLSAAPAAASAIYHLTDNLWVIPAWKAFGEKNGKATIVYDAKDDTNKPALQELEPVGIEFFPRTKSSIMHNKFIASGQDGTRPIRLLCGSANFTTGGLTTQANLLHTFESPELAQRYSDRAKFIAGDPTLPVTREANKGWSEYVKVGEAALVRGMFSPENGRTQIDTIVADINAAKHSVLFCLFDPTDAELRKACFAAGDRGLMMFGLSNDVSEPKPPKEGAKPNAQATAKVELFERSSEKKDVFGAQRFAGPTTPMGFEPEPALFPGDPRGNPKIPIVIIHHKFIVIDGESEDPIVFSGSANMSNNSEHMNDENLLEIRSQAVASVYMAEFMRLYEHYRARALYAEHEAAMVKGGAAAAPAKFALRGDASWATGNYKVGSPESKQRTDMVRPQPAWKPGVA
jgi:phosphatidylserine/phosphatidylglycerophosphate/cardiolipin synthase-like enzyme